MCFANKAPWWSKRYGFGPLRKTIGSICDWNGPDWCAREFTDTLQSNARTRADSFFHRWSPAHGGAGRRGQQTLVGSIHTSLVEPIATSSRWFRGGSSWLYNRTIRCGRVAFRWRELLRVAAAKATPTARQPNTSVTFILVRKNPRYGERRGHRRQQRRASGG
jgi:hypothetical protein